MALARVQYTQTSAGNRNFTVPMPYISRDDIFVSVDGVDVSFSWLNDSAVQLDTAPTEGSVIDVRRETTRDELLVDFQDASTITEEQLDLSAKQAFYIAQEAFDATGGTMAVANDGSYSANNRRISNVGDPDSDDDVATVGWIKAQYTSGYNAHTERTLAEEARAGAEAAEYNASLSEANALAYRNTANSHRLAAQASEAAAANSETNAANSETNAANSAAAAKASEDDVAANAAAAASSEANALTYRNNAQASANSASSNASSAANSSAKASQWAELPEDTAVEPGKYSAKHHAAKASASASASALSATTAAGYRDTANSHRQAAATSAANAASSASAAANSEANAATSETNAANSAAEAASYAAALNLPSAQGNGGRLIRQRLDEGGFEYFASEGAGGGLDADMLDGLHASSFMLSRLLTTGSDINTVTQSGVYHVGNSSDYPNLPNDGQNGQLVVFRGEGDSIVQLLFNTNSSVFGFRSGTPSVVGGTGSWGSWQKLFHTADRQKPYKAVLLFNGRQGNSAIALSERWDTFDFLVFMGATDDGDWMSAHRVDVSDILEANVSDTDDYLVNMHSYWRFDINNRTSIATTGENAVMFKIYGGYY